MPLFTTCPAHPLIDAIESIGFANWPESRTAECMLDAPDLVIESLDHGLFLLTACLEGDFVYAYVEWTVGQQPRVLRTEHERM